MNDQDGTGPGRSGRGRDHQARQKRDHGQQYPPHRDDDGTCEGSLHTILGRAPRHGLNVTQP